MAALNDNFPLSSKDFSLIYKGECPHRSRCFRFSVQFSKSGIFKKVTGYEETTQFQKRTKEFERASEKANLVFVNFFQGSKLKVQVHFHLNETRLEFNLHIQSEMYKINSFLNKRNVLCSKTISETTEGCPSETAGNRTEQKD